MTLTLTPRAQDLMVLRTTRKGHCCATWHDCVRDWDHGPLPPEHTPEIAPRNQYVEYLGESAAYASGQRYCAACAIAAGLAT